MRSEPIILAIPLGTLKEQSHETVLEGFNFRFRFNFNLMLIRIQLKKLSKKLHYEEFSAVEEEKNCSNVKNHGGGPIYFNNFNLKKTV